jgi:hypothetical protein
MRSPISRFLRLATLAFALGLASCGGGAEDVTGGPGPGPGPGPEPDPASAPIDPDRPVAVAQLVLPSLSLSLYSLVGPIAASHGPLGDFPPPDIAGCPRFFPDPPPDADRDFIPDVVTFSYDAAACDETDGSDTSDWHGALRLSDPDPGPDRDYTLDYLGYGVRWTSIEFDITDDSESNGTQGLRGNSSAVTLAERLDFRYLADGMDEYRVRSEWDLDFTAAVPGSIIGPGLPAGTVDLHGRLVVDELGVRHAFVIETLEPLVYAINCVPLVGGTFRAYAEGREAEGEVRITFRACGTPPTIVFVAGGA